MDEDGPDGNQTIYFYDNGSRTDESLAWDETQDRFECSNELAVSGPIRVGSTSATPVAHSAIGTGIAETAASVSDLYVSGILEVDGNLTVDGTLYMRDQGPDGSQYIAFYDDGIIGQEQLYWNDALDRFQFTNDVYLPLNLMVDGTIQGGVIDPAGLAYHALRNVASDAPVSSEINTPGDLYVAYDLEVGSDLEITSNATDEHLGRISAVSGTPDRLLIEAPASAGGATDPEIHLYSTGANVRFAADTNNNTNQTTAFIWMNNGTNDVIPGSDRIMDLDFNGNLRIDGILTQNFAFDIAEAFFMVEPLEAGDIVRISPGSGHAVLRAVGAGDATVIGVVSTRPGVILGGAPFSVEDLRAVWGEEIASLFETERSSLEAAAVAEANGLAEKKAALESVASRLRGSVADTSAANMTPADTRAADTPAAPTNAGPGTVESDAPGSAAESHRLAQDLALFQGDLRVEALRLFHERHFAPVALSGRVPVKVDAQFGEIRPGDLLAPSPVPGVAMKATKPGPVIGTALETFASGRGKVLALIHRGAFTPATGTPPPETTQHVLADDAAGSTPASDPATSTQRVSGNPQIVLDRGADDRSRFSIFRDGETSLASEVFRVDDEGNVYTKGSLRPASLDLAEYHPVSEPVGIGDVLVVDRATLGKLRKGRVASDPAVVGIVSSEPGILMGSGISRIASLDPELAARLDEARLRGDRTQEASLWSRLEAEFHEAHAAVALSGTVPCKADAGYGAIRVGDLLAVSATPGHAMRSHDSAPGTIVGKALEPLASGTGLIRVLVMLR